MCTPKSEKAITAYLPIHAIKTLLARNNKVEGGDKKDIAQMTDAGL